MEATDWRVFKWLSGSVKPSTGAPFWMFNPTIAAVPVISRPFTTRLDSSISDGEAWIVEDRITKAVMIRMVEG
jgi:hypothetical protein